MLTLFPFRSLPFSSFLRSAKERSASKDGKTLNGDNYSLFLNSSPLSPPTRPFLDALDSQLYPSGFSPRNLFCIYITSFIESYSEILNFEICKSSENFWTPTLRTKKDGNWDECKDTVNCKRGTEFIRFRRPEERRRVNERF